MLRLVWSKKMFAKQGKYDAAGMYSLGHLILFITFLIIAIAIFFYLRNKEKRVVLLSLRIITYVVTALELLKIVWNIVMYGVSSDAMGHYLPLYYCSLFLYALWGITHGRGKVARASNAWLIWGGIIAGIAFLSFPSSSLLYYPAFHFLSIYSIMFHTFLVLTGVILVYHNIYRFKTNDFIYYFVFSLLFMIAALVVNKTLNLNMMFLEFPIAIGILDIIYDFSPIFFQVFFFLFQLFVPYLVTLLVVKLVALRYPQIVHNDKKN